MQVRVEVKLYRRKFLQPLHTAHGVWRCREGLLIRVWDQAGRHSFGEVAPIPWFGTETWETAWQFWPAKNIWLGAEDLLKASQALPATQFAIGAALKELSDRQTAEENSPGISPSHSQLCGLLPAGHRLLEVYPFLFERGHRTFKWKIGVFPIQQEMSWFKALMAQSLGPCRLRLDANGSLTLQEMESWLKLCDSLLPPGKQLHSLNLASSQSCNFDMTPWRIDYLEQPLPLEQFTAMKQLSQGFRTPIALDESVATVEQIEWCDRNGWLGYYVIKPVIAGDIQKLKGLLRPMGPRVIFSSAFETVVGRQTALKLALNHYRQTLPNQAFPALGFGTVGYFKDDWDTLLPEQLWEQL